jgi:molecular chaperone DnaK (HSP70)
MASANNPDQIIGLDFGTSTTLVSVSEPGTFARLVPLGATQVYIPSVAAWDENLNEMVYGEAGDLYPANLVIRSAKRLITDDKQVVVVGHEEDRFEVDLEEIVVGIIRHAAQVALSKGIDMFSSPVRLGCPANWNGDQRNLLLRCARDAGLMSVNIDDLRDEPVAAGLGWVDFRRARESSFQDKVLVFDMGGGTLDVAVIEVVHNQGDETISVLASSGVAQAGDDLDKKLADLLLCKFTDLGYEVDATDVFSQVLRRNAGTIKKALSRLDRQKLRLGAPFTDAPEVEVHRSELEDLFRPQLVSAMKLVEHTIRLARLHGRESRDSALSSDEVRSIKFSILKKDISRVFLVGGMTQIPLVKEFLQIEFPETPIESQSNLGLALGTSEESVARGLAAQSEPQALNLARPPFNIILTWLDASGVEQSQILFEAFRELRGAPHTQVIDHHVLLHSIPSLYKGAQKSIGEIWFRTPSGKNVDVNLIFENEISKRETRSFLPVKLGSEPIKIKIQVDGELLIRDSDGNEFISRIREWPAVRWSAGRKPMRAISMVISRRESNQYLQSLDWWRHK